ncbi:MAG: protein phosphatase 2C domain-containing protein, partial [Bifidobacteriaceae bacterium]|nr:protein phosphatase 2C domain-containing protein [Bifidobacteriaceae bacterium]
TENQDSVLASPFLLTVADGMGGHVGGNIASSIVIGVSSVLQKHISDQDLAIELLKDGVLCSQKLIAECIQKNDSLTGMGTTLTSVMLADDKLVVAQIGDSRAYILRNGDLTQITTDHTFVQYLVDSGRITEEEAIIHPQKNIVIKVIGDFDVPFTPDVFVLDIQPGDRLLLCSDGLTGVVSNATLANIIDTSDTLESVSKSLLDLALKAGSTDNISIIVAEIVSDSTSVSSLESVTPTIDGGPGMDWIKSDTSQLSIEGKSAHNARKVFYELIKEQIKKTVGESIKQKAKDTFTLKKIILLSIFLFIALTIVLVFEQFLYIPWPWLNDLISPYFTKHLPR